MGCALLFVTTFAEAGGDGFDEYFARAARGPRDCGRVGIPGADRVEADRCVLASFTARQPFFVRYDKLGFDSIVADGLLLTRDKTLLVLQFDSMGCPQCVTPSLCGAPKLTKTDRGLLVECKNKYEM